MDTFKEHSTFFSIPSQFIKLSYALVKRMYLDSRLIALCTPLVPIDYTLLPISFMLIYQYCSKWKSFVTALALMAALFSFILEPLSEWMNVYKPLKWKSIYSFPIYIFIGILLKWLVEKMMRIQKAN